MSAQAPWKVEETIEDYELSDNPIKLKVGKLFEATKKENNQLRYVIKRMKNSDKNAKLIELEEENMKKAHHPSLAPLESVFKDEKHVYHVFKGNQAKSVQKEVAEGRFFPEDAAAHMAIQLLNFLDTIHKQGVYYLRPRIDNVFITEKNAIRIYGLDADAERFESYIAKKDSPVCEETDYFALAEFIAQTMSGKKVEEIKSGDVPEEVEELIKSLTKDDLDKRKEFKPRKDKFLTPVIVASVESSSVQLGDFKIDWSDGLVLYFGETGIGYRSGFYFESQGNSFTINGDGFTYENDEFDMTIGPAGLEINGNKDMSLRYRTLLKINEDGFFTEIGHYTSYQQSVRLGPEGVDYRLGDQHLALGSNNDCTIDPEVNKIERGMKDGATCVEVNGMFECRIGKQLMIRIGTAAIIINSDGMIIECRPVQLRFLKTGKVEFEAGGLLFTLDAEEGIKLLMGSLDFQLKSTMRIECEGFKAVVDGEGLHLENENVPLDFAQYTKSVPKIELSLPSIRAPPTPPMPSLVPSLPVPDVFSCCHLI